MLKKSIFSALLLAGIWQSILAEDTLLPVINLTLSNQTISAEIAATPTALATGLMHRQHLPENSGMLFVFPNAGIQAMWMKNTQIPLSVAFIDVQGTIINIADMEPNTLKPHYSVKTASFALEMNQGWFARNRIAAGDRVRGLESLTNAIER